MEIYARHADNDACLVTVWGIEIPNNLSQQAISAVLVSIVLTNFLVKHQR